MTSARVACIDCRYWASAFFVSAASEPGVLAVLPGGVSAADTLSGTRSTAPTNTLIRIFSMDLPLVADERHVGGRRDQLVASRSADDRNEALTFSVALRRDNGKSRKTG